MKITLYKKCILNSNYNEVFDLTEHERTVNGITENYSVFTDYLKTLENVVIDLPNTYYSEGMQFTLRITGETKFRDAYSFNYCKFEVEDLTRYCFITDIKLANTVATYSTSEDTWTNYALSMNIRYGYLTNCLRLSLKEGTQVKKINYYELPVKYESNNLLKFNRVQSMDSLFNIIFQLQCYNIVTGSETSKRISRTVLFTVNKTENNKLTTRFNTSEVNKFLTALQIGSSNGKISLLNEIKDFFGETTANYQIDNVTILPANWNLDNFTFSDKESAIIGNFAITLPITSYIVLFDYTQLLYNNKSTDGTLKEITNGTLDNNFKIYSFGTRTEQHEVTVNGTEIPYSLKISCCNSDFKLFLDFQEKSIEITENFVYEIPFNALTADITAQRKIAKNTAIYQGISGIIAGTANTAFNIANFGKGNKSANFSRIVGGVQQVGNGIVSIVNANTRQYTTNKGTFAKSNAFLNAQYGLCYTTIEADNAEYVKNIINLSGYNVYEVITDNIIFNQDCTTFNILKFDSIVIYGSFSEKIKKQLENILTNGFRVFYNSHATI